MKKKVWLTLLFAVLFFAFFALGVTADETDPTIVITSKLGYNQGNCTAQRVMEYINVPSDYVVVSQYLVDKDDQPVEKTTTGERFTIVLILQKNDIFNFYEHDEGSSAFNGTIVVNGFGEPYANTCVCEKDGDSYVETTSYLNNRYLRTGITFTSYENDGSNANIVCPRPTVGMSAEQVIAQMFELLPNKFRFSSLAMSQGGVTVEAVPQGTFDCDLYFTLQDDATFSFDAQRVENDSVYASDYGVYVNGKSLDPLLGTLSGNVFTPATDAETCEVLRVQFQLTSTVAESDTIELTLDGARIGMTAQTLLSKIEGLPSDMCLTALGLTDGAMENEIEKTAIGTNYLFCLLEKKSSESNFYNIELDGGKYVYSGTLTFNGEAIDNTMYCFDTDKDDYVETDEPMYCETLYLVIPVETPLKVDSVSMTLENNLALNFKFDEGELNCFTDWTMKFTFGGESWTASSYEIEDESVIYTVDNIQAHQMGMTILVEFSAKSGSKTVNAEALYYSIQTYCENKLEEIDEQSDLGTLLVDVLNYGAAAQYYKNPDETNFVNANVGEKSEWATESREYESVFSVTNSSVAGIYGANVVYGNSITVCFAVFTTDAQNTTVTLTMDEEERQSWTASEITEEIVVSPSGSSYYLITFDDFDASELSKEMTLTVTVDGNEEASAVYSVESYASEKISVETDTQYQIADADVQNIGQLIDAMMRYGDSAKEYTPLCLAEGTKITMADGTVKNIEDVKVGDLLLTFNHETGKYEAEEVYFAYQGKRKETGITLTFENGKTLTIVGRHDLFEQESRQYVTVKESNYQAYIGKHFYSVDDGYVKLVSVKRETKSVDYYSVYTKHNLNAIANGLITIPDDIDVYVKIYEFDENMIADAETLANDIATYGLLDSATLPFFTEEEFYSAKMYYAKIVIGKGIATREEMFSMCADYFAE